MPIRSYEIIVFFSSISVMGYRTSYSLTLLQYHGTAYVVLQLPMSRASTFYC